MDRVTGIGAVAAPPLDCFVNPVHGFPGSSGVRVDARLGVTLETKAGKVGVGNSLQRIPVGKAPVGGAGLERTLVDVVIRRTGTGIDRRARPPGRSTSPVLRCGRRR